jgi:signal transduction histidine kinase
LNGWLGAVPPAIRAAATHCLTAILMAAFIGLGALAAVGSLPVFQGRMDGQGPSAAVQATAVHTWHAEWSPGRWLVPGAIAGSLLSGLALAARLLAQNARLKAERDAHREKEERISGALGAAGIGWWVRGEDDVISAPPLTFEMCGLQPSSQMTVSQWAAAIHPDDRKSVADAIGAAREANKAADLGPQMLRYGFRVEHPEKGVRTIASVSRPMFSGQRQTGAHGIMFDDTERSALERELRESRNMAQRTAAAKSRMLATVSHDLNQPLQAMMMFAGVLKGETNPERSAAMLERLVAAMATLKAMLDSILEAARAEKGAIMPEIRDFELDPLLDEIEHGYLPRAASKGLALRIWSKEKTVVRSDPVLLGRMIRNLVENAIRYTDKGDVMVAVAQEAGIVTITVCDTGRGIPAEHMDLVWDEFHRVEKDPSTHPADGGAGLGLGLSIVRNLGRLLGHEVGFSSTPGSGTAFWIHVAEGGQDADGGGSAPDAVP